ncbi:spore cortex biosynthesis protein YabQ [Paenibacillus sp.]|uniref:spore cortex biosynthesis protein YabQ n=1 Tax=Paenibacillus sp. TaxID=58172 RepID=UPI00281270E2|nr:spore cortex biosynthesis protein YabQ [Paenibacillus sp.]
MTLSAQFLTMAAMMLSGAALGLLFDGYRVLSGELRFPRWIIPPLDILYWAVGTVAVFRVLFLSNGGEVRIYVFLALMIGVSFYFALLSDVFVNVIRWSIGRIKALIRMLIRLGDLLVVRPLIALYRLAIVILGFLAALSIFLGKLVLQLLYPLWKITLWIGRPLGRRVSRLVRAEAWLTPSARFVADVLRRTGLWRKRK